MLSGRHFSLARPRKFYISDYQRLYRMHIYALISGQLVLYIGKTNNVERRKREHRNKKTGTGSDEIPKYIDWDMIILETCDDASKKYKEQYWYDTLKPLYNIIRPYTNTNVRRNKFTRRKELQ